MPEENARNFIKILLARYECAGRYVRESMYVGVSVCVMLMFRYYLSSCANEIITYVHYVHKTNSPNHF